MSTLIPHAVCRIESPDEITIETVFETYESALSKNKSGIILDFRHDIAAFDLCKIIEMWEKGTKLDFEIICLFKIEHLKKFQKLNSHRIEIAVIVENSSQIQEHDFENIDRNTILVIQAKSKKELLNILMNHKCREFLNSIKHSFLPDLHEAASGRFSAKEYFDVVKKFEIKRDYRIPLCLVEQPLEPFEIRFVRNFKDQFQFPEISIVVPHNKAIFEVQKTIDSLLKSASFTNTAIEIITVENNLKRSKNETNLFLAGQARNYGAQQAKASIICFIDADITVKNDFFNHIKESMKLNKVIQFKRFYGDQETVLEPSYWSIFYGSSNWPQLKAFWRYTCTYALAMPKELFLRAGQFQSHFLTYGFEDVDLGYRLSRITKQFHLIDQKVFHPVAPKIGLEFLYRMKRFLLLAPSANLFFLDHLDHEVGYLVRNFLRWEHFKSRVSLCNVFFQDKNQGKTP